MIYNFNFDYKNLNELSYHKDTYKSETISLYVNGIFQLELPIFIDNTSEEDLEYIVLNNNNVFLINIKAMDLKGNPIVFTTPLCKCNNCETLLIDKNPKLNPVEKNIYIDSDKEFVSEDNVKVLEMEYLKVEETNNEYFWSCPKCKTDAFLIDLQ